MREKIVAEARSWIGTPYHNCADIKGVGVDCGMLLVRVFVDLGLVEPFDPRPYTHDCTCTAMKSVTSTSCCRARAG